MAQVDFAERQVTLKIVYYGPPLSGKTSNLRNLHGRVDAAGRGRLVTIDTREDRTLFFDLLPLFFRGSGFSFRVKVYTVPGQTAHEATRRVVLHGADGVVFVADSCPSQVDHNRSAWQNLQRNLMGAGLNVPVVVQYNKRDLVDAVDWANIDRFADAPHQFDGVITEKTFLPASALAGQGVVETFLAITAAVWQELDKQLDLTARFAISRAAFIEGISAQMGGAAT
ncbi:MAG: GTPase domain-containing protein [Kofleriaceae bacterium]|nr:GTPase domain-containing protein [Kofleriaceae bacterium]